MTCPHCTAQQVELAFLRDLVSALKTEKATTDARLGRLVDESRALREKVTKLEGIIERLHGGADATAIPANRG